MKKTPKGGIWYATDPDPRAYAEQMQAQALSAETAFAAVDADSQAFTNFGAAQITQTGVSVFNTTALSPTIGMSGATVTQYGTPFFNTAFFGGSTLQFTLDGWVYVSLGVIFTESVAPSVNQQRAAGINHIKESVPFTPGHTYANRVYVSSLNPQILDGVQTQAMIGVRAGDTLNFVCSASFSSGTVTATARISLRYLGPLVTTP